MDGRWIFENDNIYYLLLGSALILAPVYYLYSKNLYKFNTSKDLENISSLHEYSDNFLNDIFYATSSSQLAINFLNNPYLFNFFRNLMILYPSPESLLINFPIDEKREILNFFDCIKKNSFKNFSEYKINKITFYNLIYHINKSIYCLDI